jgi:uncharacterized membrane protein YidH (DUF202 family)
MLGACHNFFKMFNRNEQKESLEKQINRLEQEARMVLPGIQAIFGFQLIAVFNNGFTSLKPDHQHFHFVAVIMIAISVCLIMTPAAWHRHVEEDIITRKFLRLSSRFIKYAMFFLSVGMCIDIFIIGEVIFHSALPAFVSLILFSIFMFGWFIFPSIQKQKKA